MLKRNTIIYIRHLRRPALVLSSTPLKVFLEGEVILLPENFSYRVIPKYYTTHRKHSEYLISLLSNWLTSYYEHPKQNREPSYEEDLVSGLASVI